MKNDKKLEPPYIPEVSLKNVKEMASSSNISFVKKIDELETSDSMEENS